MPQTLEQKISAYIELGNELPEVKSHLKDNLNQNFELRPYQIEAFGRFLYYIGNEKFVFSKNSAVSVAPINQTIFIKRNVVCYLNGLNRWLYGLILFHHPLFTFPINIFLISE